jgi:O-antigen/teichoic acid export membrane protein
MLRFIRRGWDSPSLTTLASFAARSAALVVLIPLLLKRFSVEEVNVWQLLSTMSLLVALVDFGFTPTFTRIIAFALCGATDFGTTRAVSVPESSVGRGPNWDGVARIVRTLRGLYLRMSLALVFLSVVGGTWAMGRSVGLLSDPGDGWIAWGITVAGGLLSFWNGTYISIIQGFNEVALLRRWEAIAALGSLGSSAVVILSGGGLVAIAVTTQAWAVFAVFRNRWLTRSLAEGRIRGIKGGQIDSEIVDVAWPRTWRSGIGALVSVGITQLSGVAFAQFGSPSAVASYLLALRAASLLTQFSQAPFYSKLPVLARLRAQGEETLLVNTARKGMRWSYFLFVGGALVGGMAAGPVLAVIGSKVEFIPLSAWLLLSIALFFDRFGAMHLQLFSTTNDIRWHIAAGGGAILYVVTAVASVPSFGYYGFILASLLGNLLFYAPYCARLSYGVLPESALRFERGTSALPFLVLVSALMVTLVSTLN